jgi:hypothetical protein
MAMLRHSVRHTTLQSLLQQNLVWQLQQATLQSLCITLRSQVMRLCRTS